MTTQTTAGRATVPQNTIPPDPNPQIRVERIYVSPELAKEWLTRNTRNRSVKHRRIPKLREYLRGNLWRDTTDGIGFYLLDGALQNGQNRLTAIFEEGIGAWMFVYSGMPEESADAQDQGDKRSPSDVFELHGHRKDLAYVAAHRYVLICQWVWSGRMSSFNDPDHNPTTQDLLDLVDELANSGGLEQSFAVGQRVARGDARLSAAIATAVHWLATQHFGTETATRFFDSLASGLELRETDAVYRLRRRLSADKGSAEKLVPIQRLALTIKAVNAYALEESMVQLSYRHNGPRPELFPRFGQPRSRSTKRREAGVSG